MEEGPSCHFSLKGDSPRSGTVPSAFGFGAAEFSVTAVEPRKIITPNGDRINDYFMVRFDNPKDSTISGSIYNIEGRNIAEMKAIEVASSGMVTISDSSLAWDGKTRDGSVVDAGVYLYQITTSESEKVTGTVVVAK